MPSSKPSDTKLDSQLRLIVESYQRLTGKSLFAHAQLVGAASAASAPFAADAAPTGEVSLRETLWNMPCAIVAHGTETDPVFFYGNRLALHSFEMSEQEFARLPSRLSAEPMAQAARVALLEKVSQQGYVAGYSGMRIAKSGRRFLIEDCTVWNLIDEAGVHHGQAAVFVVCA